MASFILREIDDSLWKKVKSKAAAEGITLKELVTSLIEEWVKAPARKR
jgi:predicted DNA binding CopG/RHH family protein